MTQADIQLAVKTVVDGIVKVANPERVVLFGSAANNASDWVNDLDFLVVVRDSETPVAIMDALNLGIRNKPMPCDFIVATPSMLRRQAGNQGSVLATALREGREVYAR